MLAADLDEHTNFLRKSNDYYVLPTTLIIGTNGAGKSNLFQALKYLQRLLNNNKVMIYPHKLSDNLKPTNIDLQFIEHGIRYAYGIEVLNNQIIGEYLYYFENDIKIMVFERTKEQLLFNDYYIKTFEDILSSKVNNHFDNLLLLSLFKKYSTFKVIHQAYEFLTTDLIVILSDEEEQNLFNYAMSSFTKTQNQEVVNHLLSKIDIGIKEFYYSDVDGIMVRYDVMDINIEDESTGTKKLFSLLNLISEVINNGRVLLFDELERNLHLNLVKYIIQLFNSTKANSEHAQMIFSTHSTTLLDLSMFRQDQVWFMEKDFKMLSTELYSLVNISDIQKDENIERGYILGKYGATFHVRLGEDDER